MNETSSYPKVLPPMGLLIAILLMISLHFLFPITQIVPGLWRLFGILPVGLGIAISYAAENQFHQAGTTVNPSKESTQLVTDGLYRFSRNPMYLGMILILLGVGLLLGGLTPFLVAVFYIGWVDTQFIRLEEHRMSTQFGQDWLEYKKKTRRWI